MYFKPLQLTVAAKTMYMYMLVAKFIFILHVWHVSYIYTYIQVCTICEGKLFLACTQ